MLQTALLLGGTNGCVVWLSSGGRPDRLKTRETTQNLARQTIFLSRQPSLSNFERKLKNFCVT